MPLDPRRILLVVATVAALAGVGTAMFLRPAPDTSRASIHALLSQRLVDANGNSMMLDQWKGHPLVVNFWATWCAPCREEMPLLAAKALDPQLRGVQVIGIAVDSAEAVGTFARANPGMPYPLLIGGIDQSTIMSGLGNSSQVLPFTVFIDAEGNLVETHKGALKEAQLSNMMAKLLARTLPQK